MRHKDTYLKRLALYYIIIPQNHVRMFFVNYVPKYSTSQDAVANNKKAENFSLNLYCKMYVPGEYI